MTDRPDRIPCSVPFCRRTAPKKKFPEPGTEIICGKHWRLADVRARRLYSLAWRKYRRTGGERYMRIICSCWRRVLKQATERSAGITA